MYITCQCSANSTRFDFKFKFKHKKFTFRVIESGCNIQYGDTGTQSADVTVPRGVGLSVAILYESEGLMSMTLDWIKIVSTSYSHAVTVCTCTCMTARSKTQQKSWSNCTTPLQLGGALPDLQFINSTSKHSSVEVSGSVCMATGEGYPAPVQRKLIKQNHAQRTSRPAV